MIRLAGLRLARVPALGGLGRRERALLLGWVAALVLLGVIVDRLYSSHLVAQERMRVETALLPSATALTSSLNQRLAVMYGLRALIEARRYPSPADLDPAFDAYVDAILSRNVGLRAVQVVVDGRFVYVRPVEGNEVVVDYDLRTHPDPRVRASVDEPRATGQPFIAGPIELIQGGTGVIARLPVRMNGQLWGLVTAVVDLPRLYGDAGLTADADFDVALANSSSVFFGDSTVIHRRPVAVPVTLPGGTWTLYGAPVDSWQSYNAVELALFRVLWAILILIALALVWSLLARRAELQSAVDRRTTALRETALRLRREEDRLEMVVQAARLGLFDWQLQDDELTCSDEAKRICGLGDQPVDATMLRRLTVEDDRALFDQRVRHAIDHDAPFESEHRITRPDTDEIRTVYMSGAVRRDATGQATHLIGVLLDLTELRDLEERLRQSQKMESIGTLAGGIAHDFNNLLTAILGYGEFALQALPDDGPVRDDVGAMVAAAERARLLTGQLLAFSRRQLLTLQLVDANEVVRDVARLLERVIGEDVQLALDLSGDAMPVRADVGQLSQVLLNLATNARDAMPRGGRLGIRTRSTELTAERAQSFDLAAGRYVNLQVSDTGTGIPPAALDRIFDPYYTTKPVGKGTGLGLSTVYGIVRQSNGHVHVDTTSNGSTFHVLLPLVEEPAATVTAR